MLTERNNRRKSGWKKLALAGALLIAILFFHSCGKEELPKYEGITLKQWVERLDSEYPSVRIDALKAIEAIGLKARPAEDYVLDIARNDNDNDVRMQAIKSLQAMNVPVVEFDEFVEMYEGPIISYSEEEEEDFLDGYETGVDIDEIKTIEQAEKELMEHASVEDDLEFLMKLESGQLDSEQRDTTFIPINSENYDEWLENKRSSAISDVLDALGNPENLIGLLKKGEYLDKVYAAGKLAKMSGSDPDVINALEEVASSQDSVLSNIAKHALQNWK